MQLILHWMNSHTNPETEKKNKTEGKGIKGLFGFLNEIMFKDGNVFDLLLLLL